MYADSSLNPSLIDDTKVLGTLWNTSSYTFNFTIQRLLHDLRPEHITKRQFLQFSASVFDLLSVLSSAIPSIEIEKCYSKNKEIKKILVVGFCDASKIRYAVFIYLCTQYKNESRSGKMIAAKTRVAPLTNQTIPRLELLGAMSFSRIVKKAKRALKQLTIINSEI